MISLVFLIKGEYSPEADLSAGVIVLLASLEILLSLGDTVIAFKSPSRAATLQSLGTPSVDSGDCASLWSFTD